MKALRFLCEAVFVAMAFIVLQGCKPGVPKGVMKMSQMEKVLYDYHLAQALAGQFPADSIDYYTRLYQQSALKKNGISKSEFDHSMEYYERHTDQLKKIYEHLAERFGGSIDGASSLPGNVVGGTAMKGDTLNIWHGATEVLLSSQGVNRFTYTQRCDTTLHAGDQLQMTFNVDWFYHEGERRGVAQVIVHYEGDSIAVMQHYFYSSGSQFMSLTVGKRKVERIDCFIYQCSPWSDRTRIVKLSNIKLYRLRSHDSSVKTATDADSLGGRTDNDSVRKRILSPRLHVRDSLIKEEKENERKPHFI